MSTQPLRFDMVLFLWEIRADPLPLTYALIFKKTPIIVIYSRVYGGRGVFYIWGKGGRGIETKGRGLVAEGGGGGILYLGEGGLKLGGGGGGGFVAESLSSRFETLSKPEQISV